ncbi:hypothetical protein HPB51_023699 [Rhipicephalus microplus]|uniref:Uncharacterized protein n=1 Tax=Rhipicephalus microplus TaxID=6941 RepID=A0A9J6F7Z4_RHIMP|nr:hypothetical protein HPB51_025670 [Rhipicephalus microplus]KAH8042502.1 hypothetical protein HPB51_023699 [Rhipicephalus microplus]
MAASNGRGVASPAVVASNASETKMQPAKNPRRCFSAHEDLCLLREVAAAKPFGDDIKWVHVLAAVNRAVGRELTLRGKEEASDVQQRFDPPAVLVIYSPESCLLPGYDSSNWQIMPFGHIIAWYFRAWTLLWPLKYTFWFLVGRHIGCAVPSMKAQHFVSGAPFA